MAEETTIGVYFAADEADELEEFDQIAARAQNRRRYSRSRAVRDAMEMYRVVLETMDDLDWDVEMAEPSKRHTVRAALQLQDRVEGDDA